MVRRNTELNKTATTTSDIYPIGQLPELGVVPKTMYAYPIRRDRYGSPAQAFQREVVPVPVPGPGEVLIKVMAAGVNYNNVWAATGKPIDIVAKHTRESGLDYHIGGSDASGVVWAVGPGVKKWKPGQEVIVHCNQTCGECPECNGGNPMYCNEQQIWGYETNHGSFAQFALVQAQQLMPKPPQLTWEEAAGPTLVLATAYSMLFGHPPHTVRPGMNVLVWGGAGGLGVMAIQLVRLAGANPIAVISSDNKEDYVLRLGAVGAINRHKFDCWGEMPNPSDEKAYKDWLDRIKPFGKEIWKYTGQGNNVDLVFEHPGEATFPVSAFVCKPGGMVVICAGTSGYKLTADARIMWMRRKRFQGSHFANAAEANAANKLLINGQISPCLSEVFQFDEIPLAHQLMSENKHKPGNMSILVDAPRPGLKSLAECYQG